MKEISKKNLLSAVAVFSFVAFCFAIANTFGSSYALDTTATFTCPSGYTRGTGSLTTSAGDLKNECYRTTNETSCNSGETIATHSDGGVNYCYINSYNTVTFDSNGGNAIASQKVPKGSLLHVPTPTKTGYEFQFWYNPADEDSEMFEKGDKVTVLSDFTLKAVWKKYSCWKCEATNTYEWYLGVPEQSCASAWIEQTSITSEANCKAPSPSDGPETGETPTPTTYKVYFGSITDYDAKFYKNGTATTTYTQTVSGSSINLNNYTASSDEWNFEGWTYGYNSDGSCQAILPNTLTLTKETTNVYACWSSKATSDDTVIEPYTATFNPNEGTLDGDDELTCKPASANESCRVTDLPTAEREGYTFKGWGSNKTCTSGNTSSVILSSDKTYYACWEETVGEFNVKFNTNNGTLYRNNNSSTTSTYKLSEIDYSEFTAKKDDSIFKGWRTSSETCDEAVVKGKEQLTDDLSLYACYEKDNNEITENPGTGSTILYLIVLIGTLSLGYTSYSTYRYIKLKK